MMSTRQTNIGRSRLLFLFLIAGVIISCSSTNTNAEVSIKVVLGSNVAKEPANGRIYVLMNNDTIQFPIYGPNSSDPQPFFSKDVSNWQPGDTITLDSTWNSWQDDLDGLSGDYAINAVLDRDSTSWNFINAENYMSVKKVIHVDQSDCIDIYLELEAAMVDYPFTETDLLKELVVPSPMLTEWYGRPIETTAGVLLPPTYHDSTSKKYPVVYVFPGWGGSRYHLSLGTFQQERYAMTDQLGCEKIFVFMDQQCPLGYHVFANSDNNGPRADAFVQEFIPAFENGFRAVPHPKARFLLGQSSGGWAALYLQITFPEYFAGAWAGSPDPVDFRYFQCSGSIYERNGNFLYNSDGSKKAHSRKNGSINVYSKTYCDMEQVLGIGGQLGSYESVFSRRGSDGKPEKLFDRVTGKIDSTVAEYWKKYDLNLIIKNHSETHRSHYSGKLHIFVSKADDYYLDLAVSSLKKSLEPLEFDADITILNSGGHSVWNDEIRATIYSEIDDIISDCSNCQ